jgi:hypothetical protein
MSQNKKRLSKEYGMIHNIQIQHEIIDALCFQLGINQSE